MAFTFNQSSFLLLDGGMGTQLQARGLKAGELPESWCLTKPDAIVDIHLDYLRAGANVVLSNTFGANRLKLSEGGLSTETVVSAAVSLCKKACRLHEEATGQRAYAALDLGPTGRLLKPIGDLPFDECVDIFADMVRAGRDDADLIVVETMTDPYELKAAVLAAKENSHLPILATVAVDERGRLLSGLEPEGVVALLEGLRVDALGFNCGADPRILKESIQRLINASSIPVVLKLNAGLPVERDGKTVFDMDPEEFGHLMASYAALGAHILGGCCGTTPLHIAALAQAVEPLSFVPASEKSETLLCSYGRTLLCTDCVLIGERINPTGKKAMQQALRDGDMNWMRRQAILQEEQGAQVLDINVGLPGLDEKQLMANTVCAVQEVCALPVQIDASLPEVLESGLRHVNGKAMINSVSGKQESLDAVLPLVQKYGGVLVALTLDEDGIPPDAKGRLEIARKIVNACEKAGIHRKDIVIDPLCMTISTDKNAALTTLEALRLIKEELQVKTVLGVSNISFGLPDRGTVNTTFLTLAMQNGLDFAIMNPGSEPMLAAHDAYLLLSARDEGAKRYIARRQGIQEKPAAAPTLQPLSLRQAVEKGLKQDAAALAAALLQNTPPLELISNELVPALNAVGDAFGNGTLFLPELMMSADAASAAFDEIRRCFPPTPGESNGKPKVIVATVKGDIHDIGKNIVRVLLENYGFSVIDLGKDVPPQTVVDRCLQEDCRLVGLSALMTTTVESMRETIALLKERCPDTHVMVGGAVLNAEYAQKIGAGFYGKTAMDSVRFAQQLLL